MPIKESILLDLIISSHEKQAHAFNFGISNTHLLNIVLTLKSAHRQEIWQDIKMVGDNVL